jgi:alpha-1,2-mannosyltransferase
VTVLGTGVDGLVGAARTRLRSPGTVLLVAVPAVALAVTWILSGTRGYHIDLEVYRIGVQTWLDGGDMYGDLPATATGLVLPFIYPPFAAMVLVPLVLLPWTASWVALFLLSLASLAVTLYVVARRVWPAGERAGALAVAALALPFALLLEPVWETFRFGQVNLVLMALVAVDCLVERPRWPRGMLVGIAAAIKLTPAAFVLFFLLRRDLRAAVVAVATAAVATGIGFLVDAPASARYWLDGPAAGVSGSVFYTNQTLQAVLSRAGAAELTVTAVWALLTVALLLLIAPVVRRDGPVSALVAVAAFALLVSPTSWSHHWVWAAPALLLAVAMAVRLRSAGWAVTAAVLMLACYVAPFQFLPRTDGAELAWSSGQQVLGSTYVIVAIALLLAQRRHLPRAARHPESDRSETGERRSAPAA